MPMKIATAGCNDWPDMIEKYVGTALQLQSRLDTEQDKVAYVAGDIHVPAAIQEYIRLLKADPRFAYMHVIAMSDGDNYGSNLNGDIFSWDQLLGDQDEAEALKNTGAMRGVPIPRYKTFEQARFFKHHNNKPHSPFYGDVPLAAINLPMKRVELIVRIAREDIPDLGMCAAPDVCIKLDNGGIVCVSMGCRIHHEQCSYCGAENEFVSQRCPHLRDQMGEIMPNGVKVAAFNFGFRFFDLSKVTIPADPIAMSLSKVAMRGGLPETLIMAMTPNTAFDVKTATSWRRKWAEIEKEIPADAVGNVAGALGGCACGSAKDVPPISPDELKKAMYVAQGDPNEVVSTLAMAGVVLSPVELAQVAQFSTEPEKFASGEFRGVDQLALDRFNYFVYDALREKIAARSGFLNDCPETGWEPTKLGGDIRDYYAYYRACLSSLPSNTFTKAAHALPPLRQLLGESPQSNHRLKAAMYYLARAGMAN